MDSDSDSVVGFEKIRIRKNSDSFYPYFILPKTRFVTALLHILTMNVKLDEKINVGLSAKTKFVTGLLQIVASSAKLDIVLGNLKQCCGLRRLREIAVNQKKALS